MPDGFISNSVLSELLTHAEDKERLALTQILDSAATKPLPSKKLQEEICLCGGHAIANWIRDSGTGYLDIIDDVTIALDIDDREDYDSVVKYYDEIYFIKGEEDDKPVSSTTRKYDKQQATILGKEYAARYEEKIVIKLMENAYKQMKSEKDEKEESLAALNADKASLEKKIYQNTVALKELQNIIEYGEKEISKFGPNLEAVEEWMRNLMQKGIDDKRSEEISVNKEAETLKSSLDNLSEEIPNKEKELAEAKQRLEDFDSQLSETIKSFDSSHLGVITGTAGLMVLANLGGFATYTFLTSLMSTLSFGTLSFGAYTAATSLLSVVIGPVGWAGLGMWAFFKLGKPDMNKLILLVATIGAIRQRVLYEGDQA